MAVGARARAAVFGGTFAAAAMGLALSAGAEPAPVWVYVDPAARTCGELWGGDERVVLHPASPSFRRLAFVHFDDPVRCQRGLQLFGAADASNTDSPCEALHRKLMNGLHPGDQKLCETLGYTWIGRLPSVSRPYVSENDEDEERSRSPLAFAIGGVALALAVGGMLLRRRVRRRKAAQADVA